MENENYDTAKVENNNSQHPTPPKSTLLQRIRALDRRRDLISAYTPFVVGSIHDEGATIGLGGVVVGQAETSFIHSTVLNCMDRDGKPVFELVELRPSTMTAVADSSGDGRCGEGGSRCVLRMCIDAVHYRHSRLPPQSSPPQLCSNSVEEKSSSNKGSLPSEPKRTAALHFLTLHLLKLKIIPKIHTDTYPLSTKSLHDGGKALARINRSTSPYLGVISVGVHLHCYVVATTDKNDERGGEERVEGLWLAQRAPTKLSHPNKWDTTVAGGQPYDRSLFDNVIKEGDEEAGVPEEWIRNAYCGGSSDDDNPVASSPLPPFPPLSIMTAKSDGSCMKPSLYYSYDLCVPKEWVPTPVDGEVSRFELFSMEGLREEVVVRFGRDGDSVLRPAMGPVLLDFMVRHGVVTGENEDDFGELGEALYGGGGGKDVLGKGMYDGIWG